MQKINILLRFPIADMRRSGNATISTTNVSTNQTAAKPANQTTECGAGVPPPAANMNVPGTSSINHRPAAVAQIKPQTMIAFRRLRDQCLTLHVFDLSFQNVQQPPTSGPVVNGPDHLTFTIVCSQINAYYQYSRRERPIHFGLVQAKTAEPRSLYCSIKVPVEETGDVDERFAECGVAAQTLDEKSRGVGLAANEMDSLKQNYNIDFGMPNRFYRGAKSASTTIREETADADDDNERHTDSERDEVTYFLCPECLFLVFLHTAYDILLTPYPFKSTSSS